MRHQTGETSLGNKYLELDLTYDEIYNYLIELTAYVDSIRLKMKNKKISRVDVALISRQFFYNYFSNGLEINNDPFSSIITREEEGHNLQSDRFDYIVKKYITSDVLKYFGLSLTEFLEYPTLYSEKILDLAMKCKMEVDRIADKINKESEVKIKNAKDT